MRTGDFSGENLNHIFDDINYDLNLLYSKPCDYTSNLILNHLRDKIFILEYTIKAITPTISLQPQPLPIQPEEYPDNQSQIPMQPVSSENNAMFTSQDLSGFDGMNGNPAYVAINGIVYDVTDNAAWAAATHFGLRAGNDLTGEFASCHAGQPILSKLKVVGRLVDNEK
jgi:predicted heme/steroid binding protein